MDPISIALFSLLIDKLFEILIKYGVQVSFGKLETMVRELMHQGYSIADIPILIFQLFNVEDPEAAEEELENEITFLACPTTPNEKIIVSLKRGKYICPYCDSSISTNGKEAWHEELLSYDCPDTGEKAWAGAEVGDYICQSCRLSVEVREVDGYQYVFHQLRIE